MTVETDESLLLKVMRRIIIKKERKRSGDQEALLSEIEGGEKIERKRIQRQPARPTRKSV